jgi:hypothetical protein
MTRRLLLVLCLLIPCLLAPALGVAWPIKEGDSYGPLQLGQKVARAERTLGKPKSSEPSASDPSTRFNTYAAGVMLLVNGEGNIIGITVTDPQARTASGLGVGSSSQQVQKVLGTGLQRGPNQVAYPTHGIGFAFSGANKVERVFLFKKEGVSPLQGDRLIVPGQRCGDIKVGMTIQEIEAAWGPPSTTNPAVHLYQWAAKGVGVTGQRGRVVAITLSTGDYVTRQGLKVGSLRSEVLAALGQPQQTVAQQMVYKQGIMFTISGEQVAVVQVFSPNLLSGK